MSEPTPIVVPHSGVVETVFIIEWLKAAGDRVEEGEEVVVIESEKAEGAIEAPASGTLEILIDRLQHFLRDSGATTIEI